MEYLLMFAVLNAYNVRLGSEKVDSGRSIVVNRDGTRVFGSNTYTNMEDLNKALIKALIYEHNKIKRKTITE